MEPEDLEIETIVRQPLPGGQLELIGYAHAKACETEDNRHKGVHFFEDDYRFAGMACNENFGKNRLAPYAFRLSPDYSRYNEMPTWSIVSAIGNNRKVGARWQREGHRVFASVGWSTPQNYKYCFLGVETGSVVAVTTLGSLRSRRQFMHGYDAMLDCLKPEAIICYGVPFLEMRGELIVVELDGFKKN